jgi:hypothetical protein
VALGHDPPSSPGVAGIRESYYHAQPFPGIFFYKVSFLVRCFKNVLIPIWNILGGQGIFIEWINNSQVLKSEL